MTMNRGAWLAAAIICGSPAALGDMPPAAAFAALPELSMVRLSPNGQRVAWANDPGGTPLVVVFDLASGKDLKKLGLSASRLRALDWANDRTLIISVGRSLTSAAKTTAERRYEFERYLALDVEAASGEAQSLLMEHPDREHVTGATLEQLHTETPGMVMMSTYSFSETAAHSEMGSRITGGRRDAGYELSLFEVDVRNGKGRKVESGSPYTEEWAVDPSGHAVARIEWNPVTRQYAILAKDGGSWRSIFASDHYAYDLEGVSADGKSLVATSADASGRYKAWSIPLAGGTPAALFDDPKEDVTRVVFDRFSGAPSGYWTGGLAPTVHWVDPRLETIQKALAKAFAGKSATILDRSIDYKRVVAEVEGAGAPPVYYLVDFGKGSADIIGEEYPGLAESPLGTLTVTSYESPDGRQIPAYLTMPPGADGKNLPLVVFPHGGPYARDSGGFDWWAQFLATRGYVVLQPQFRGSVGFGADLVRAGDRQWGRGMQDDITAGVRELVDKGIADPQRICIVGASYGGYAALAGAAFTPDLYACAASINGISDIPQQLGYVREKWGGDDSDAYRFMKESVGNPSDAEVIAFSPSRAVEAIRVPILLVHGANDTVVPPSQSRNFARLLEQHGKDVELVELPGEDHWLSSGASRLAVLQALESFLAANLRR